VGWQVSSSLRRYSPAACHAEMAWMVNAEMHWGDDSNQQQAYVDVHAIHRGLRDGTLAPADAVGRCGRSSGLS
jgi:hypothetical protein